MQSKAEWSVSNLSDEPIRIVRAFEKRTKTEAYAFVENREEGCWGSYAIRPKEETGLSVDFFVCPLPYQVKDGGEFRFTVILIDNLGNRYSERIVLQGLKRQMAQIPDPGEAVHAIADPVEKQVASVFKDELARYKDCGRRVGGLGSVQTHHGGRNLRGVGSDTRTSDVPTRQAIAADAERGSVSSDNASALCAYFKALDDSEADRFVSAITYRMSRDTEYTAVGYLGLLVLFRIGRLRLAMETAIEQLKGDEEYGFSDLLRLLDGLLRFEHPAFTEDDLDVTEGLVREVDEHAFRILERVAAIRALRLEQAAHLPVEGHPLKEASEPSQHIDIFEPRSDDKMKNREAVLMQTQRIEVLQILTELDFSADEFSWEEEKLEREYMTVEAIVSKLVHIPTEYSFEFDMRNDTLWAAFSPGVERPRELHDCKSWADMLHFVKVWGVNLRREVQAGGAPQVAPDARQTREQPAQGGKVFIGHGSSRDWRDLKDFLSDRLGLEWEEFNREPAAGLSTKERLQAMLDSACIAFLVLSAEDVRSDGTEHARENVVHELGLFQGRLGFERAIILLEEGCSEFSNIHGITQIRYPKGDVMAKSEEIRRVLEREGLVGQ